jgi:hypothetical protein
VDEPAIEHGADIANNTWQHWTGAAQGLWSRSGAGDSDADLTTLAGYASHHPQATLAAPAETTGPGGLSIIVGAGGTGQDDANFYVDGLHVRYFDSGGQSTEKTYDFEPVVPKPTISAPRRVTGPTTVTVHGTAVPNSTVTLFEKRYGHDTEQVGSTTADDNGKYAFERNVRKQTKFRVRNYDKFSDVAKTNVRVELDLRTSSPNEGRLKMVAVTHPHATGEKVRFFHIRRNGERDLLATCRVHDTGRCGVRVNAPSGRTWTLFATVTSPPGNLAGHSAKVRQTIR